MYMTRREELELMLKVTRRQQHGEVLRKAAKEYNVSLDEALKVFKTMESEFLMELASL
jgi:hypothetical protein